jgi:hypothetical protein
VSYQRDCHACKNVVMLDLPFHLRHRLTESTDYDVSALFMDQLNMLSASMPMGVFRICGATHRLFAWGVIILRDTASNM